MSDFDDQARAASERLRRRATALAAGVDREARLADPATSSPIDRSTARWLIPTGAVAAVAVGVIGVLAIDREPSSVTTDDERSPTSVVTPTPTTPTTPTTALAQAVPLTEPPDATVTAPPTADLTRPVADPTVCESFTAIDGALAGLPLNPGNLPLTLFARPSSAPIPIQIIGNPVDGPTKPFAVIQRSFDAETEPSGHEAVDINGVTVWVTTHPDGNVEAVWNLADGTQGYLRSRGLTRDDVVAIVTALTPRPPDSAIAGFDYDTTGTVGLELVTEQLNTDVTIGKLAGSQCRVAGTGSVYRIWAITGDTLYQFASVIDRPVPLDVGITNGTVIVISGPAGPIAPTAQDVIDADKHTWLELLNRPADQLPTTPPVEPIGDGLDVVVELVPIDPNQPTSSLTLRLNEQDGIPILEVDTANAVLTDAAQYWKPRSTDACDSATPHTPGLSWAHGSPMAHSPPTSPSTSPPPTATTSPSKPPATSPCNHNPDSAHHSPPGPESALFVFLDETRSAIPGAAAWAGVQRSILSLGGLLRADIGCPPQGCSRGRRRRTRGGPESPVERAHGGAWTDRSEALAIYRSWPQPELVGCGPGRETPLAPRPTTCESRDGAGGVWRNRDFMLVLGGGLVNNVGDWLLVVALPAFVYTETGSGRSTAAIVVIELVVGIACGPYGGSLADRWDLRRTIIVTNLAQAAALLPLLTVTPDRIGRRSSSPECRACCSKSTIQHRSRWCHASSAEQLVQANSANSASSSIRGSSVRLSAASRWRSVASQPWWSSMRSHSSRSQS